MTDRRRPATLHYLACYVLREFDQTLRERKLHGDLHRDHRMVYEKIFFLCGDALRSAASPCDLGLQTVFRGPTPESSFEPFVRLDTVRTTLRQCVENGWLLSPGPRAHATNYALTGEGKTMARKLADAPAEGALTRAHLETVRLQVARWAGATPWELLPALRKVAADAYLAATVVPHYDLSDRSLAPFLSGVAARSKALDREA